MQRVGLLVLIAIGLISGTAFAAEEQETVTIIAGRSHTYHSPVPIGDISNSNAPVVGDHVNRKSNEIVFFGNKAGEATYVIHSARNQKRITLLVRVVERDVETAAEEIRAILADLDGVTVRAVGQNVLLEGTVLLPENLLVVDETAKRYPEVINLVGLDETLMRTLAEAITDEIDRPGVRARAAGDVIFLEGTVTSEAEKQRAEKIAEALLPRVKSSLKTR